MNKTMTNKMEKTDMMKATLADLEMEEMKTKHLIDKVIHMQKEWEVFASLNAGQPMPKWDEELFYDIISALYVLSDYEKEERKSIS